MTGVQTCALPIAARGEIEADAPVIGAGCGRFIARHLAQRLGRPFRDFAELIACAPGMREMAACCAPAVAVGLLAERELLLLST